MEMVNFSGARVMWFAMTELSPGTTFAVVLPPAAPVILPLSPSQDAVHVVPVPGPRGLPGSGVAAEVYEFVQATPAASWLIEHPSSRPPAGLSVVIDDEEVIADVLYQPGYPRVTVVFAAPVAGRAFFL